MKKIIKPKREIIKPKHRGFVPLTEVNHENIYDTFAYVAVGGKLRVVRSVPSVADEDGNAMTLEFMSPEEFKKAFLNKRRKVKETTTTDKDDPNDMDFNNPETRKLETTRIVKRSIAELFLTNPKRMTYDRLVFEADPARVRATDFNMWNGFSVEPKKGKWPLMNHMIMESLAAGDFESYLYIKKFCAWALQNPTRRAGVALVLRSDMQGTGKGLLGNAMCKFFGSHAVHLYRQNALVAKFNSQLAMCGFLFDDESTFSGDAAAASVAKGLITEPTIDVERKGVDVITLPNCLTIMKATNSKWAVPAESGDRRYAVFETSNEMANDHTYWEPVVAELTRAMLYDLLAIDLKGWKPSTDIPDTDARAEQKKLSLSAAEQWLLGFLESSVLPNTNPKYPNRVTQPSTFYESARRSVPGLRYWSAPQFATFLDEWGIETKESHGLYRDFGDLAALRAEWKKRFPWYQGFKGPDVWSVERSEYEDAD
jgi:hypothetical protein